MSTELTKYNLASCLIHLGMRVVDGGSYSAKRRWPVDEVIAVYGRYHQHR